MPEKAHAKIFTQNLNAKSSKFKGSKDPIFLSVYFPRDTLRNSISCCEVYKKLKTVCGEPLKVVDQARNAIMIQCKSSEQSEAYMKTTEISNTPIEIKPHPILNTTKGTISGWDLLGATSQQILEDTEDQGVYFVRQLQKKHEDGRYRPTNIFELTFDRRILPSTVKVAWMNLFVRPYINEPKRCHNCLQYGHIKKYCRRNIPRCFACGKDMNAEHKNPCINEKNCFHCNEKHVISWKGCNKYKIEKEIIATAEAERTTLMDAHRKVKGRTPNKIGGPTKSYSNAAKQNTKHEDRTINTISQSNQYQVLEDLSPNIIQNTTNENNSPVNKNNEKSEQVKKQFTMKRSGSTLENDTIKRSQLSTSIPDVSKLQKQTVIPKIQKNKNIEVAPFIPKINKSLIKDYPLPPDTNIKDLSLKSSTENYKPYNYANYVQHSRAGNKKTSEESAHKMPDKPYKLSDFKRAIPQKDPRLKTRAGQTIPTVIGATKRNSFSRDT